LTRKCVCAGLHNGHMTKQQYVASEAYARALR
jgi:hypothetical protein